MAERIVHLLVIDPQNDFCDIPDSWCPRIFGQTESVNKPALPVGGAHADMQRLAQFIERAMPSITELSITLDAHHQLDIAHPGFWKCADGREMAPFTPVKSEDVRNRTYLPRNDNVKGRVTDYLVALEDRGRYTHMVWPVHCEIGSWGANVHEDVKRAYNRWEQYHGRSATKVLKGTNPWTEHFSAIEAEVPIVDDMATQVNEELLASLSFAEILLVAGEAGSHCVKSTVEHIVSYLPEMASRIVLLTDCMSAVSGFETQYQDFISQMAATGVRLADSISMAEELRA